MTFSYSPMVSVIIPVYNAMPYLEPCINSILNQTYKKWELICIDDGSTDESLAFLRKNISDDFRCTIIQQPHSGVSVARNTGIAVSQGTYLMFVDADDFLAEQAIETLVHRIVTENADLAICGAKLESSNRLNRPQRQLKRSLQTQDTIWRANRIEQWPEILTLPGSRPYIWNKIFHKKLLIENNIAFNPQLCLGEDLVFLFSIFPYCKTILYMQDKLYHYRISPNSAVNRYSSDRNKKYYLHLTVVASIFVFGEQRKFFQISKNSLFKWALLFLYNDFLILKAQEQQSAATKTLEIFNAYHIQNSLGQLDSRSIYYLKTIFQSAEKKNTKLRRVYWILKYKYHIRIKSKERM